MGVPMKLDDFCEYLEKHSDADAIITLFDVAAADTFFVDESNPASLEVKDESNLLGKNVELVLTRNKHAKPVCACDVLEALAPLREKYGNKATIRVLMRVDTVEKYMVDDALWGAITSHERNVFSCTSGSEGGLTTDNMLPEGQLEGFEVIADAVKDQIEDLAPKEYNPHIHYEEKKPVEKEYFNLNEQMKLRKRLYWILFGGTLAVYIIIMFTCLNAGISIEVLQPVMYIGIFAVIVLGGKLLVEIGKNKKK